MAYKTRNEVEREILIEYLKTIDLTSLPSTKKIPLIKMVREYSRYFDPAGKSAWGLKDSKELVESVFTNNELYPKVFPFTPKAGDTVLVCDSDEEGWTQAIYLCTLPDEDYPYITVLCDDEEYFPFHNFRTEKWRQMRKYT